MGIEVRAAMKGLVERLLSDGATGDILLLSRTAKAWTEWSLPASSISM